MVDKKEILFGKFRDARAILVDLRHEVVAHALDFKRTVAEDFFIKLVGLQLTKHEGIDGNCDVNYRHLKKWRLVSRNCIGSSDIERCLPKSAYIVGWLTTPALLRSLLRSSCLEETFVCPAALLIEIHEKTVLRFCIVILVKEFEVIWQVFLVDYRYWEFKVGKEAGNHFLVWLFYHHLILSTFVRVLHPHTAFQHPCSSARSDRRKNQCLRIQQPVSDTRTGQQAAAYSDDRPNQDTFPFRS